MGNGQNPRQSPAEGLSRLLRPAALAPVQPHALHPTHIHRRVSPEALRQWPRTAWGHHWQLLCGPASGLALEERGWWAVMCQEMQEWTSLRPFAVTSSPARRGQLQPVHNLVALQAWVVRDGVGSVHVCACDCVCM